MFTVRLVIVLGLYAFLVAAALITVTVVLSVSASNTMNKQVVHLANASMTGIKTTMIDRLESFEKSTFYVAMSLARLRLQAPLVLSAQDVNDYVVSWGAMTIPAIKDTSKILSTFEMWLDESIGRWYMTGCNRQTQLCSLHDAAANTTQFVQYNSSSIDDAFNLYTTVTKTGPPPLYPRYLTTIAQMPHDKEDWWSDLYIDYASSVTTHTCKGVDVAKTMDYFHCTAYTTTTDADGTPRCRQLVGITVESTEAGAFQLSDFIIDSTIFLASTKTVDNVGGICDPEDVFATIIRKFMSTCDSPVLEDCKAYLDPGKAYVYMVLGYTSTNGISYVFADRAPRYFFFETIDHSQDAAIAIAVVMIVLVVIFSIIFSFSIVVPLNYICQSMKNASNLTYEKKMAPITKYTIFSEVKLLCASYLDLRQALKDLKAFMPQGLLIGPDEAITSTSLLAVLMGTDPSDEENEEDEETTTTTTTITTAATTPPVETEETKAHHTVAATAAGTPPPPPPPQQQHRATPQQSRKQNCTREEVEAAAAEVEMGSPTRAQHSDPSCPVSEALPEQRYGTEGKPTSGPPPPLPPLAAATVAEGVARRRSEHPTSDGENDDVDAYSPHPHRRPSLSGSVYSRGPHGIVSLVPVNTADDVLVKEEIIVTATARERPPSAPPAAEVASAGAAARASTPKERPASHVRIAEGEYQTDPKQFPSRASYSLLAGDSSRGEGASLQLNRSVYNGGINKFRKVTCTLVCMEFTFKYVDEQSLGEEVSQLMNILIRIILRFGGVIEVFRPETVIVSFGAHATASQHTQRAVAAALTISKKLSAAQRARTRIVVDTGSFFCGTCGANGRISPVLFGDRFDAAVELIRYDLGLGRLIVTDRVALCLPSDFVVPFDYLMTLRDRSHGTQLFLVVNPAKRHRKDFRESVGAFRRAYALASGGQYAQAVEAVARGSHVDAELAGYCATTFKFLMTMNPPRPRYCRFQLPGFEPLGVVVKEKVPKYQHDRLHLNEIEPEEEEHISINFGFGGGSSSITTGNVQDNNQSQSRVFMESSGPNVLTGTTTNMREATQMNPNQSGSHHLHNNNNPHPHNNNSSISVFSSASGGSPTAGQRFRNRAASRDDTTQQRSFQVTDDYVGSTSDQVAVNASQNSMQLNRRRDVNSNMSHAGDTGRTDCSDDGLPLIFADHKGEKWHRFPTMIGSGAFAEVYKAISENGSLMALKCIHLAATNVQLADVVSEVNTACKLFSDFIVNHVGWAHVGSYMVIIMDYMPGGSLHTALSAFPTGLTLQVAKRYASDALRGLAYLHRSGVVHADFKPQNILLATDGGCRLSDFGSSVTKANARTSGGDVFHLRGTPAYMSPEVARGDSPSMKSDMWSFGVTLYEMLTGRLPWVMRKGGALPAVPGGSFQGLGNGVVAGSSAAALTVENALVSVVSEGYNSKVGVQQQAGVQKDHGTPRADGSYIASGSGAAAPLGAPQHNVQNGAASLSLAEWVPLQGLSDVRVVQGIANGSVRVHVEQAALPTLEAYQLIISCLQETPQGRPISWEVIDHSFFFS